MLAEPPAAVPAATRDLIVRPTPAPPPNLPFALRSSRLLIPDAMESRRLHDVRPRAPSPRRLHDVRPRAPSPRRLHDVRPRAPSPQKLPLCQATRAMAPTPRTVCGQDGRSRAPMDGISACPWGWGMVRVAEAGAQYVDGRSRAPMDGISACPWGWGMVRVDRSAMAAAEPPGACQWGWGRCAWPDRSAAAGCETPRDAATLTLNRKCAVPCP